MSGPAFGAGMFCHKIVMGKSVLYKKSKAVSDLLVQELVRPVRMKKVTELF